jgi:hypothetical protein
LQEFVKRIDSGFNLTDHESAKSHELRVLNALDVIRSCAQRHPSPGVIK